MIISEGTLILVCNQKKMMRIVADLCWIRLSITSIHNTLIKINQRQYWPLNSHLNHRNSRSNQISDQKLERKIQSFSAASSQLIYTSLSISLLMIRRIILRRLLKATELSKLALANHKRRVTHLSDKVKRIDLGQSETHNVQSLIKEPIKLDNQWLLQVFE